MRISILFSFFFISMSLIAQDKSFKVEVSSQEVLLGNYLEIRFTAENMKGDFEAPSFSDFDIIGGPNMSSSMNIINGDMSQSISYSYYIKPRELGNYTIEPAYFTSGDEVFETIPLEVVVLANPDGIIQKPPRIDDDFNFFDDSFLPFGKRESVPPAKKKRKLKKI